MRRNTWLWIGAGSVGAWLLFRRCGRSTPSMTLGSPVEATGPPRVTPHGYFGAARAGPPRHAHQGLDIAAPPRSYVLAVGDGVIVPTRPGLGKTVRKLKLDTPGAWDANQRQVDAVVYADLGAPLVEPGDRVSQGDPVALVDHTGFIHFAVKQVGPSGEIFFDPTDAGFLYRPSVLVSAV